MLRPNDKWGQPEWDNFYRELGRPETPDKYPDHSVKLPEGLELDPQSLADAKKALHEAGLTPKQAQKALDYHVNLLAREHAAQKVEAEKRTTEAKTALREAWGPETDANLALARAAVLQHGGQELLKELEANGLGNSVPLIKMLHKVATMTKEDISSGGAGSFLAGKDRARARIEEIKSNTETLKALADRMHPNHAAIQQEWVNLHGMLDKA